MAYVADIMRAKKYTCLTHATSKKNLEQMQSSHNMLHTAYDRYKQKVHARGIYSYCDLDFDKPFTLAPGDFPGIYMSVVTDIEDLTTKRCFMNEDKDILLVFPLELMNQHNWHFNVMDRCGAIGYDTYFPSTVHNLPMLSYINAFYGEEANNIYNELVFHHSLNLCNVIEYVSWSNGTMNRTMNPQFTLSLRMNLYPLYIFYSDMYYSGRRVDYLDRKGVSTTTDSFYIEFIRDHLPNDYKHICDGCVLKDDMENKLLHTKVNGIDLMTYLYTLHHDAAS